MAAAADDVIESGLPEFGTVPLDEDLAISDEEYARIMRRIMRENVGTDTPVSAFNSSI